MADPTSAPLEECPLFNGDVTKCNTIYGIRKALAALSLIGCVFMITVIWIFKKYELFVQRLILWLTVAAFFGSISKFLESPREDSAVCNFEGWWTQFWDWVTLMWVSCITFNLYLITIWMINTERREIIYHLVTWGFSFLMACLPLIGNHYGPAGAWCWIPAEYPVWRFFIWYGPLFLLIILMFAVYAYITYKLRKRIRSWQGTYEPEIERNRQLIREEIKPLRAYPFIYLVLSIFPLINRIQNAVNPDNAVFVLYLFHALSAPLVGLVNAIVYGLDPETRSRLTWTQIKLALKSRRAEKAVIKEYTIHSEIPAPDAPPTEIPDLSSPGPDDKLTDRPLDQPSVEGDKKHDAEGEGGVIAGGGANSGVNDGEATIEIV
ncbi:cyclic AMP receptor-like protein A isoform X1 [Lytechinus variegatus]|uniref:cyclic AMP receptor-like protein A isoform X1 n=1 Tax=Lytechinus variegatus TaxID=7654 RepID=UPI001BB156B4|nr:cyclic AMP receptor-like protein A isoform X1 [Lytechinus variegatus]